MSVDSNTEGSSIRRPGGKLMGEAEFENPLAKAAVDRWTQATEEESLRFTAMLDPDFVEGFISIVTDPQEQLKYVLNTAKSLRNIKEGVDPNYVLVFRRTLPSDNPKPERHWSTEYLTVRNGLRQEIPGVQRLYSVILCSSLADVLSDSTSRDSGFTDGEIRVNTPLYDQKRSLFSFRPKDQEEELKKLQQTPEIPTLSDVAAKLKKVKD